MSVLAGPVFAFGGLLGVAGVLKLGRPGSARNALEAAGFPVPALVIRFLGVGEIVVGAAVIAFGGSLSAAALAVFFFGFAAFAVRLLRRDRSASCGCFGRRSMPVTSAHVIVNLLGGSVAAAAVRWPTTPLTDSVVQAPLAGIPFIGLVLLGGWLLFIALTELPALQVAMRETGTEVTTPAAVATRLAISESPNVGKAQLVQGAAPSASGAVHRTQPGRIR
ncbi:MAG: hypothetical protein N2037_09780 [Acidimicrobiales bacterium]|nr:hypothetical protein [Acidimicrobiales bacterium]